MSYEPVHVWRIITRVLDARGRPQAALRVWAVLQLEAGPKQEVEIGRDDLAQRAGVSVGTVSRVIPQLAAMGALDRLSPRRGPGPITLRMKRFW